MVPGLIQPQSLEFETLPELEPTASQVGPDVVPEPEPLRVETARASAGIDMSGIDLDALAAEPVEPAGAIPLLDVDLGPPAAAAPVPEPEPEPEPEPVAELAPEPVIEMPAEEPAIEMEPEVSAAQLASAESAVAQSMEFVDLGNVEAEAPAAEDLETRLKRNPQDWEAHRLLGEALIEKGEREKGLAELDAALDGFDQADDLHGASSLVDEILRLEPNSVRHQQKRVELAYRQGDRDRLVDAYVELADALLRSNEPDKAVAVYRRVLEHDTDNVRARTAIETLAPAPPPAAAAPAAAAPAPAAAPKGDFVDLGSFLLDEEEGAAPKDTRMRIEDEEPTGDEQKDFQQMLAAFKRGIEANVEDTDFQSHYDLGVAYKEMGLLDEAIAEFQKALRAPDGRLKSSEALGLCFFEKGQFAVAEAILRRGLDVPAASDAERIGLLYWLGRTLEEQGKGQEALLSYNRVFAVDINFADVNTRVQSIAGAGA